MITGAANGIGRAVAALMVAEGASVLIADLDLDATVATAAEICEGDTGGRAAGIPVDVTDEGRPRRAGA